MKVRRLVLGAVFVGLLFSFCGVYAQDYRTNTRKGNKEYNDNKYEEAEISYRKALMEDSTFYKAQYNMGDALYKEKRYNDAVKYFNKAVENPDIDKETKAKAYYNMGNSYLQSGLEDKQTPNSMENFKNAVSAYQNSLKLNPKDPDAKYNLSYAKKMLQQMQQQQKKDDKQQQQQNQQQQDQQQKNQNKEQDKKDKQDQQQQQQQQQQQEQNKDKQKKQPQPQSGDKKQEQKKKDAERILDAVKNNEKKTLDKQKVKVRGGKIEKDW